MKKIKLFAYELLFILSLLQMAKCQSRQDIMMDHLESIRERLDELEIVENQRLKQLEFKLDQKLSIIQTDVSEKINDLDNRIHKEFENLTKDVSEKINDLDNRIHKEFENLTKEIREHDGNITKLIPFSAEAFNGFEKVQNNSIDVIEKLITSEMGKCSSFSETKWNSVLNSTSTLEAAVADVLSEFIYRDLQIDRMSKNLTTVMSGKIDNILACTSPKKLHGTSCYEPISDAQNWQSARDSCVAKGGDLVKIETDEEYNFLKAEINYNFWIGLNDMGTEGQFHWANGFVQDVAAIQHWFAEGEPNNANVENCIEYSTDFGNLNDRGCEKTRGYVCEIAI